MCPRYSGSVQTDAWPLAQPQPWVSRVSVCAGSAPGPHLASWELRGHVGSRGRLFSVSGPRMEDICFACRGIRPTRFSDIRNMRFRCRHSFFSRGRHAFGQTYKTYVLHSWPCKTYETYVLHVGRTVSRARTFTDTRKAGVPKRAEHKARRNAHPHREHAEHFAHTERPQSSHRTRAAHTRSTQNP